MLLTNLITIQEGRNPDPTQLGRSCQSTSGQLYPHPQRFWNDPGQAPDIHLREDHSTLRWSFDIAHVIPRLGVGFQLDYGLGWPNSLKSFGLPYESCAAFLNKFSTVILRQYASFMNPWSNLYNIL